MKKIAERLFFSLIRKVNFLKDKATSTSAFDAPRMGLVPKEPWMANLSAAKGSAQAGFSLYPLSPAKKKKPRWRGYPAAPAASVIRLRRASASGSESVYFHFSVFFRGAFGDNFSAKSVEGDFGLSCCPPGKSLKPTLFTSGYSLSPRRSIYLFFLPECFMDSGSGLLGPKPTSALAFCAPGLISGFFGLTKLVHLLKTNFSRLFMERT